MVGDAQSHWTLRHAVGLAVAADLLLTGRTITGETAAARGIASRALPADEVLSAALDLAHSVATEANPASVAHSKRLLWSDLDLDAVQREETRIHLELMGGADATEGAAAWRENRPPRWSSSAGDAGDPA
jgi:enoyl-CoA hydratase/carnithine racemase